MQSSWSILLILSKTVSSTSRCELSGHTGPWQATTGAKDSSSEGFYQGRIPATEKRPGSVISLGASWGTWGPEHLVFQLTSYGSIF